MQAQIAVLPPVFLLWFRWMFAVIVLAPIVFIRHRQGRIVLIFSAIFLAVQLPLVRIVGLTNFLSLAHLLIWGPLVVYLCRELRSGGIAPGSLFGVWAVVAVATAIVSLVFDVRDFGRWVGGERGVVQPPDEIRIPWLWVTAILASLAATGAYVFGGPSRRAA